MKTEMTWREVAINLWFELQNKTSSLNPNRDDAIMAVNQRFKEYVDTHDSDGLYTGKVAYTVCSCARCNRIRAGGE